MCGIVARFIYTPSSHGCSGKIWGMIYVSFIDDGSLVLVMLLVGIDKAFGCHCNGDDDDKEDSKDCECQH